jgi:hypothetical protein
MWNSQENSVSSNGNGIRWPCAALVWRLFSGIALYLIGEHEAMSAGEMLTAACEMKMMSREISKPVELRNEIKE